MIFFFVITNALERNQQYNPFKGGKETKGRARPLQVGGGGEKGQKWEYSPSELEPRPNTPHGGRRSLHFY
jgi:hypothetical protein